MTNTTAAQPINSTILEIKEGCESNGVSLNDLVREFFNCEDASVDAEGDIWIANPQAGHWLSDDEKARLIEFAA